MVVPFSLTLPNCEDVSGSNLFDACGVLIPQVIALEVGEVLLTEDYLLNLSASVGKVESL